MGIFWLVLAIVYGVLYMVARFKDNEFEAGLWNVSMWGCLVLANLTR